MDQNDLEILHYSFDIFVVMDQLLSLIPAG